MITNDAVQLGILALILGLVFYTSHSNHRIFRGFYRYVPALLLCYFLPSLLTTFNIIDTHDSQLYYVASRYLLPASLVLLTLSIDFKGIINLGPKALILFLTGTVGIVIGGPLALLLVSWLAPGVIGAEVDQIWRGMTTIAGSWIGGSANQTAMKEVFQVGDGIFSAMVAVDVIVANLWMAVLLLMAGRSDQIDQSIGANNQAITDLRKRVEKMQADIIRIPSLNDLMLIAAVGFTLTGLAHWGADILAPFFAKHFPGSARLSLTSGFFWLIIIATTLGLALSFTKARQLEGAGASKVGSVFIYFLVATIGTHMDLKAIFENPGYFLIGILWMMVHASLMLIMCRVLRAPVFYMAVGSQANVGGAASAPVVAAAFHPSLAPVGVLLAVMGYALGTYAAWICGLILQTVAQ